MTETLKTIPAKLAQSFPYTLYAAGLLGSMATGNMTGVAFTGSLMLLGDVLNGLTKATLKRAYPNVKWMQRPNAHTWGMPSGHAQMTALAAVFWSLYLWRQQKQRPLAAMVVGTVLMGAITFGVMYSRYANGCHNVPQLAIGGLVGAGLGAGLYWLFEGTGLFQWFELKKKSGKQ